MPDLPSTLDARKRSVDNLQRLYTVTITLATTEILRRAFHATAEIADFPTLKEALVITTFLVTVVPFYHGANRHLDARYVTREQNSSDRNLLLDFWLLFIQGLLFFVLAIVSSNIATFYHVFLALLFADILFVLLTDLANSGSKTRETKIRPWMLINTATLALIFLALGINIWNSEETKLWCLTGIAAARTIADYYIMWSFYFPPHPEEKAP